MSHRLSAVRTGRRRERAGAASGRCRFAVLLPNLVTLLALCAGLTSIRMAIEGRYDCAVAAIVVAAVLDGIDGRVARTAARAPRASAPSSTPSPTSSISAWRRRSCSTSGGSDELALGRLDRRARLRDLRRAAARALQRHARRSGPAGLGGEFLRRHARAGRRDDRAAAGLLDFLGVPRTRSCRRSRSLLYVVGIALLMVSKLPTWSGKRVGQRVPREHVLLVFVLAVLFAGLLLSYPWEVLTHRRLAALSGLLPFSWLSYRGYMRKDVEAAALNAAPAGDASTAPSRVPEGTDRERPTRLN